MPTTIQAGFEKLRSNLEVTGLQKTTLSERQTNVRDVVAKGFNILDSFLAGSYARSSLISPLSESDVDIFFVLAPVYFSQYTPASLLDRLRTVLLNTYTKTPKISRNGQAVTITFNDFRVDAVPSFYREGGGFLIPDSTTGEWISTDPTVHDSELTTANRLHNSDLIPLVKMIKGWNRCIGDQFYGFYLELLVKNVLNNITISDFPSGVRYVFDKGREAVKYTIPDPSGFSEQVRGLNNANGVSEAVTRFQTAYGRAVKAEAFAAQDKIIEAYDEWRKIFQSYFPAFG